jgi:Flp pilus assembly secretin CpaC/nucleoid-associated protein YgaU
VGQRRIAVTPSYRFGISEAATFVTGGGGAGGVGGPGAGPTTGSGPTIGGFQPPTGGNSIADFDHLIIQDYESNLQIIDQIIQRIDVRPVQVLIEAVIISVDYEHDRELGVNLGLVDNLASALGTLGSGTQLNGNVGFTPTRLLTTGGKIAQGTVADAQGFASGTTTGIKFGFVSNNVTGFIRALETIGSTKILASPRILVLNKQRAEIQLGSRLGFQTLSQNFTSTIQQVQFLNTGTLLRLRPFVSDDGMVRMEIHPERSSGSVTNNIPNQNTAELTTNVMVPDGATLVIGGLIEDEDDYSYQGLPLASRFPALSFLTGLNQKQEGRRELVVLLTPHIWSVEQAMAHAPAPHPNGAFSASGPVANTSTTFDLETGKPVAGTAATRGEPGIPVDPFGSSAAAAAAGAMPNAPGAGAPASMPIDGRTMIAASGGPSQPGTGTGAPLRDADPRNTAPPQRRRWPSLREWVSRRTRDKNAGSPAVAAGGAQPLAQGPNGASMPGHVDPSSHIPQGPPAQGPNGATTPGPVDPSWHMPQGASQFPGAPAFDLPPLPSPQESTVPENRRPNLDFEQVPARPIRAAINERIPPRDPMLAQAAWHPDRVDQTQMPAKADERRASAPVAAAETEAAASARVVAGPRRHTIARGETLASIARQYYGSDRYAESLRQFNRGRIARGGLRPGDLLVIPPRTDLHATGGWVVPSGLRAPREPASSDDSAEAASSYRRQEDWPTRAADRQNKLTSIEPSETRFERVDAPARRRLSPVVHVVEPDETPRSIARDRLGDPGRAREIIELNQHQLATEGRWRPGLRILLPADAGPSDERE